MNFLDILKIDEIHKAKFTGGIVILICAVWYFFSSVNSNSLDGFECDKKRGQAEVENDFLEATIQEWQKAEAKKVKIKQMLEFHKSYKPLTEEDKQKLRDSLKKFNETHGPDFAADADHAIANLQEYADVAKMLPSVASFQESLEEVNKNLDEFKKSEVSIAKLRAKISTNKNEIKISDARLAYLIRSTWILTIPLIAAIVGAIYLIRQGYREWVDTSTKKNKIELVLHG